jgi:hypothetical protein
MQHPLHRRGRDHQEHTKAQVRDRLAADTGVLFSVAAFTTYGGWGSEFRNKFVEPFYKSELKDARRKSQGWRR